MLILESPLFWLLAISGVILTGISKSGFAGGAGVVAVPLLALVIPVEQAAALMLPLLIVMDARTVLLYRDAVRLSEIKTIVLASILGIAIAGSAMAMLSSNLLQLILAVFCIAFASWQHLTALLGKLPGSAYIWGTISGISSTLLHAGGPPISIYFLSKSLPKRVWLAQAAVFFAIMNVIKLVPYSLNKAWSYELWGVGLILFPLALIGVYLGHKIQSVLTEASFTKFCRVLLGLTGAMLLFKTFY